MLILSYIAGEAVQLLPAYKVEEYASRAAEALVNAHVVARTITSEQFSLSYWGSTKKGAQLAKWIAESAENYIWFRSYARFLAIRAKDSKVRWRVEQLKELPTGVLGFTPYPIEQFVAKPNLVKPYFNVEETSIFNPMRMAGDFDPVLSSKKEIK